LPPLLHLGGAPRSLCAQPLDRLRPRQGAAAPAPPHSRGARAARPRCRDAAAPAPYRLIITILRETGMRAGEVLALRSRDVTLDAGREALRVREPKNGIERAVVLGPTATPRTLRGLRAHCRSMRSSAPSALLFRSNRGQRVD